MLRAERSRAAPTRRPRAMRRRRWLARLLRLSPLILSLGLMLWALSTNPFAAPLREATRAETTRMLDAAIAQRLSPDRLEAEIAAALEADDLDRIETLLPVAARVGVTPGPEQAEDIAALRDSETGLMATARDCAICVADVAECPSLRLLAACGIPVELTPVGDLNALRRAGVDWWNEEEIDRLDVTLASIGLLATGAILVTGGTSASVKAGATGMRVARRMKTLTAGLADEVMRVLDPGLVGRIITRSTDAADTARTARAQALAADVGRVAGNTSITDTALLLRHVDGAEDAARLARLSDAAGPETRGVLEVLGKSRAFRTLARISDEALAAAALIWLAATQALMAFAGWLGARLFRPVTRALAGVIAP